MECRNDCGRGCLDNRGCWSAVGMVRTEQSEGRWPGGYNATGNRGARSVTSHDHGNTPE